MYKEELRYYLEEALPLWEFRKFIDIRLRELRLTRHELSPQVTPAIVTDEETSLAELERLIVEISEGQRDEGELRKAVGRVLVPNLVG